MIKKFENYTRNFDLEDRAHNMYLKIEKEIKGIGFTLSKYQSSSVFIEGSPFDDGDNEPTYKKYEVWRTNTESNPDYIKFSFSVEKPGYVDKTTVDADTMKRVAELIYRDHDVSLEIGESTYYIIIIKEFNV